MSAKVVTRRSGKADTLRDAAILLRTIRRLRGDALVPRGVFRFRSAQEADQWMMRQMTAARVRRSSKTSSSSAVP